MYQLDKTDIDLLRILQQNASLTIKQIALNINMSLTAVFERKKDLENNKVITHYAGVIDPEKTDFFISFHIPQLCADH